MMHIEANYSNSSMLWKRKNRLEKLFERIDKAKKPVHVRRRSYALKFEMPPLTKTDRNRWAIAYGKFLDARAKRYKDNARKRAEKKTD